MDGVGHVVLKNDALSSSPKGGAATDFSFKQTQVGFTIGGPITRDQLFYFASLDLQKATSTKQTDPTRIEKRVVDAFSALGSPNENGSIGRTNDARVFLGKLDWAASARNLATLRYHYTSSDQKNGTFYLNSLGLSANADERDSSNAGTGSLISTVSNNLLNEFRFQYQ